MPRLEKQAGGPLQYLRLAERDYLVVVDEEGQPRFFDRRGQKWFEIPDSFRLSTKNPFISSRLVLEAILLPWGRKGRCLKLIPMAR
jgi:hypothetical protein